MSKIEAGSRVKMDIREDEEQEVKCHEVMELFLTAGYFRARIKVIIHLPTVKHKSKRISSEQNLFTNDRKL